MKHNFFYIIPLLAFFFTSCYNSENDFPDFTYKAVYFPNQYPVRTLTLGNDRIDNTLDNALQFNIEAAIGGMYKNSKNWTVDVAYAPELLTNAFIDTVKLLQLPQKYIKATSVALPGALTIPSGSFNGGVLYTLDESFLDDPNAFRTKYVLPLVITKTSADTILKGVQAIQSAISDRRKPNDWVVDKLPKDYILYAVRFTNKYDGGFLHKGIDQTKDIYDSPLKGIFSERFIERNTVWDLSTTGRNSVIVSGNITYSYFDLKNPGKKITNSTNLKFNLNVESDGNVKITPSSDPIKVTGTGKYLDRSVSNQIWGDYKSDAFFLNYSYTDATAKVHNVTDTLIFRNRKTKIQNYTIKVL